MIKNYMKQNLFLLNLGIILILSASCNRFQSFIDVKLMGLDDDVKLSCPTSIIQGENYSCPAGIDFVDVNSAGLNLPAIIYSMGPGNTCSWATVDSSTGEILGTPNDDQTTDCVLEVSASDGTKTASNSVTLSFINSKPTLSISDAAMFEDSGLTTVRTDIEVQANEEGYGVYSLDNTTASSPKCSDHGTLAIDTSTGSVTFDPALNYTGDCIVKVVFDDQNTTDNLVSAEFTLTVTNVNDAPVVSNSCSNSMNEDANYSCTANVSDIDSSSFTWSLDASTTCAWASINSSTGVISGIPHDDQVGTCTIAFKANDGGLDSNVDSFSVTIANVQPTLTIANASINEDAGLTEIRNDGAVNASDETHGIYSLDAASTTAPKCSDNGSVTIDSSTGAVSYNPSLNYYGTCNVKVVFDDQNSVNNTVSAEFAVTVTNVNDAPVVTNSCSASTNEDQIYSCSPGFSDVDAMDTMTWSLDSTNTCSWVTINSSTGVISGTPNDDHVGTCTLAFKANDGTVDSNVDSFTLTINNVQPTLTIANTTIIEDDALAVIRDDAAVSASDEGYGVYSLDAATTSSPKCSDNGTVSIDTSTGSVSYAPALNYNGTCNIKVVFDDENSINNTVSSEFSVTVTPVNDAPTIALSCLPSSSCGSDLIGTVDGTTGAVQLFSSDNDMSNTQICFMPSGSGYNIFKAATSTFPRTNFSSHTNLNSSDDDSDEQVLIKPIKFYGTTLNSIWVGSNGYLDNLGSSDYSPTDSEFNSRKLIAPFWTDLNPSSQGAVYFKEESDRIIATWDNVTDYGESSSNNAQIEIYNTTGEIIITFGNVAAMYDSYVGISNAGGSYSTFDFNGGVTTTPTLVAMDEDTAYSCSPIANDVDGDTVTWSLDPATTCSWASINATTGEITGTPIDDHVGTCSISFKVNDGALDSSSAVDNFQINNLQPTLTIADTSMNEDGGITIIRTDADVQASDETWGLYDLDNLTVTNPACSDNGTLSIDADTGQIVFTPNLNYYGVCNVKVEFDDGNSTNNTVSAQFSLTVNNVNDAPVASSTCATTTTEGIAYSCTPTVTDVDTADTHTWSLDATNTCAWATINSTTGVVSGTPNDDQVGTCTLAFLANDGALDSNLQTYTITVENGVPQLTISDTSLYQDSPATIIRTDADVQSNNEGSGVYSLDNASASTEKCSDHGTVSIDSATGEITYTPAAFYVGDCHIKVVFDDEHTVNNLGSAEFVVTVMDNAGPSPLSLDSTGGDKTYLYGETVQIQVHFNEDVYVDTTGGTPKFKVETGTIDKFAIYVSGSGTPDLTFEYLVGIGDEASDLDVHSVFNSLELSGGTIKDNFNNDIVSLVLPVGADVNSLATKRNIVIDTNIDYANFSGQPTRVSAAIILNVDVFGDNLTLYKYKVQSTSSVDCSDETGYSSEIDINTNITDNISAFSNGTNMTICIVGKNTVGNWQPFDLATQYNWTKDKYAITILDFTAISNIPTFKDAAVAPNNDAVIYARNLKGEILRTIDSGVSWKVMCKLPSSYISESMSKILVSAGEDYTAYVTLNNDIYRVDDLLGGSCLNMSLSQDQIYSDYVVNSLTMHPSKSELYAWAKNAGIGSNLVKSIDRGESWVTLSLHSFYNGNYGTLAINPSNDQQMASYRWGGDDVRDGYYFSTDAGANWTFYSLGAPSSYTIGKQVVWNPLNTSYVYSALPYNLSETPYTSATSGTTWSQNSGLPIGVRWTMDGAGKIYYLYKSGFDTILRRSPAITTPSTVSFSNIYTFSNLRGVDNSSQSVSVSNSGNTFATIVENKLFLSFDAGVTFNEVNWQGSKTAELHSVTTEDGGQTIYGVTPNWSVVKTVDGGQNWTYQYSYHEHCSAMPRIRVSPVSSNNVILWPDNMNSTTSCNNIVYSNDGMASASFSSNGLSAPYTQMAMSPVDQERFFYLGSNSKYRSTKDGGISWVENSSLWSTSFLPETYSHPTISDLVWVGDISSNGKLWEYDTQNNVRTDITSRLGLSNFAGFNVVKSNGGQFLIRAISKTGVISESTDDGATFTPKSTSTTLTSCAQRLFYTHPKDFNVVTTACIATNKISFSRDAGNAWIEMDLSSLYGINCGIRGVAIHLSKLFIACTNSESLMINYTPLELVNDVYDGVLSSTEISNTNDLIVNINEAGYVAIEYAVIPAADVCNQTVTTFSTAIPKSNDSAFVSDGNYKVCAKLTDNLGVDFYETSSIFTVDTLVPTFTSIDLLDEASDGYVKFYEHYKNINPLVGNLVASGHDTVLYSLVTSGTTCDSSLTYEQSVPSHYSKKLTAAGDYKVCVKLTDYAGHPDAYGESAAFNFSPTYAIANISGIPARVTRDNALDITVSGDIVTKYKYKLGLAASVTCTDSSGYSSDVSSATKITDSLTGFAANSLLRLCVLGSNASDDWQPYQFVTEYKFSYATVKMDYIYANSMNLPYWQEVAVAPSNASIIYAKSMFNEYYKSTDGGSSWELQCVFDNTRMNYLSTAGYLFVSNGSDATGYVTTDQELYKIERIHGGNCTNLTSGFSSMNNGSYITRAATTDTNGNLYFWEEKTGIGLNFWKSTDQGERFNLLTTHTAVPSYYGRMDFDPSNPNNVLAVRGAYVSGQGIYKSTDGGVNWTFKNSNLYTADSTLQYLPGNSSYVFGTGGYYSTDGGENWVYGGTANYFGTTRFYLDGLAGYRFKDTGAFTELQRASDMTSLPPTWTTIKSFNNANITTYGKTMSANGAKISVVSEGRLYISNDTGATWTEIRYPNDRQRASGFAINKANDKLYASLMGMRVISSNDLGANWTFKAALLEMAPASTSFMYSSIFMNPQNESQLNTLIYGVNGLGSMGASLITNDDYSTYSYSSSFSNSSYNNYTVDPVHSGIIHKFVPGSSVTIFSNFGTTTNVSTSLLNISNYSSNYYTRSVSILPSNENAGIIFSTSRIYRYQAKHASWVDITSNMISAVRTTVAGNETFRDSDGFYKLRAISSSGAMAVSADNGDTWTQVGATSPSIGTCSPRMVKTNELNPNTILTYCPGNEYISLSRDAGNTWKYYNLSNYAIDCNIGDVDYTFNKIFVGCSNDYGLIIDVDMINFSSVLADGVLNTSEIGSATDLFTPISLPNYYSSLKYKIVPVGTNCDNALTYSSAVPQSNASELSTDGTYKICIEVTDTLSNITYEESHDFRVDQTAPAFTSIDLANAASDGFVSYNDKIDNPFGLVSNLIGSNFDISEYAIVDSAVTCDSSLTYSRAIPSPDSEVFINSGTYKVCVKLTDIAGNTPAYGSSSTFSYDNTELVALLNNLPEMVTNVSNLNINVSGPGVTHYRYKISSSSSFNCADAVSYSSDISISTPITSSLSGYTNNSTIKICVIGTNGSNITQPLLYATTYSFVKNAFILRYYNFNGANYEVGWNKAEVAPNDSTIIYAVDKSGMISKSTDSGSNWTTYCKILPSTTGHLKVSKDGSKAYASDGSNVYYVFDNKGGKCKYLRSFYGDAKRANFDIFPNGDLFIIDLFYTSGSYHYYFYKYTNNTESSEATWIFNSNSGSSSVNTGHVYIDPFNSNNIIWNNSSNSGYGWYGLNMSNDGGYTWVKVNATVDSGAAYKYDPAHADYVYSNTGKYSTDGGVNFTSASGYITASQQWAMDSAGKAYHLKVSGSDTILETSPDMISPSWSNLITFTGLTSSNDYVSATGSTIAVTVKNKLFISTDSGVTFNEVVYTDDEFRISSIDKVGNTLYAATHSWDFLKSTDNGQTWAKVNSVTGTYTDPPYLRVSPSNANQVFVMAQDYTSTYDNKTVFTHDGFSSLTESAEGIGSYYITMAISPSDDSIAYFLGNSTSRYSTDAGDTFTQTTSPFPLVWSSAYSSFVSPADNDLVYVVGANYLWEYDQATQARTDVKSRLSFVDPAGMDMYYNGSNWTSVVVSRTGLLNESTDDFGSFSTIGSTTTALSSCTDRHFKVLQDNPQVMVTACQEGVYGGYTTDGGANWTLFTLSSSLPIPTSCNIDDIDVYNDGSENHLIISCRDINALEILF